MEFETPADGQADAKTPPELSELPPPPEQRRRVCRSCVIAAVLLAVLVLLLLTGEIGVWAFDRLTRSENAGNPDEVDDVTITECDLDSDQEWGPFMDMAIRVENDSSKPSDYSISINVVTADNIIVGEAETYISSVAPGQTAIEKEKTKLLQGITDAECVIAKVDRDEDVGW